MIEPRPDADAIEEDRPHADQAVVLDGAAVQDDPMADGDPAPDRAGDPRVGVDHREVLDVRLVADRDPVGVAAEHGVVPDARLDAQVDVAEDDRPGGDEGGWVDHGGCPWVHAVGPNHSPA